MGKSRQARQATHPRPFPGVYRRSKKDQHSGEITPHGKWLPRMKPHREHLSSGEKLIHDHLPLGGYDTPEDAKIVRDIAAFYYGQAEGELTLASGQAFSIPPMTEEEKQSLHGMEKRQWICRKAKDVFEDFQKAKKAATSTPGGASVSSEAGTTVVASSPEITGSLQLASISPEDSALHPIFEDLQFNNFDIRNGFPNALDLFPISLWAEGDALGSTSKETTSMEVQSLQQQLCESQSQNLELQRQLGEAQQQLGKAQMQILELQCQMDCVKSNLQQNCFASLHEPYWILLKFVNFVNFRCVVYLINISPLESIQS